MSLQRARAEIGNGFLWQLHAALLLVIPHRSVYAEQIGIRQSVYMGNGKSGKVLVFCEDTTYGRFNFRATPWVCVRSLYLQGLLLEAGLIHL